MKKKHKLPDQPEKEQLKSGESLTLPSAAQLSQLTGQESQPLPSDVQKLESVQNAKVLADTVMANLTVQKTKLPSQQSISHLESLAMAEVLNIGEAENRRSPSVAIYEQNEANANALPDLLQTAENIVQKERSQNRAKKLKEAAEVQPKSLKRAKPLLQLTFDNSLSKAINTNSTGNEVTVRTTKLNSKDFNDYIAKKKIERIFPEAEPSKLLFGKDIRRLPKSPSKQIWLKATLDLLQSWRKEFLEKINGQKQQEGNALNVQATNKTFSSNLATVYLLLTALFVLLSYCFWALLPGSFLTVYKTQVSGYVLKTFYSDCFCFALPAFLLLRNYKSKNAFLTKVVGHGPWKQNMIFMLPLLAVIIACLLTASNRLFVINIFAKQRTEILEAPFMLLNVTNRQSFLLLFACSVVLSSVIETLCICGVYRTALKIRFTSKQATWLCALLWPFLYVTEVDFISLFIFAFILVYFAQICDNIYQTISLNVLVKICLLVERQFLPFMVQRNGNSYSSQQAMAVVDVMLIIICLILLRYIITLLYKQQRLTEPLPAGTFHKKAAQLLVTLTTDAWHEHQQSLRSFFLATLSYLIIILNYALYWYFS